MVYTAWKIEHYAREDDNNWSSTATEVSQAYDVIVRTSLGEGKDTFEFKVTNFGYDYNDTYKVGDKIILYYKSNVASSDLVSSDVIMNGIVTDVPQEESGTTNFIRITGSNYSESLMNALVFYDPAADTKLHTYLQEALNSISHYNQNFKVGWSNTSSSTKIDGSDFPVITEKWYYKNMLKLLEKYSQDQYTTDGNYYWYVNIDNELVWKPKTQNVNYAFDTSIDDYKALKIKKDLKEVINFVIVKGGNSPSEKPITVRVDDPVSRAKNGFKYYLMIKQDLNDETFQREGLVGDGKSSRYPASYSHTTFWGDTVSSDSEYDDSFREYMKGELRKAGRALIDERKNGKLMVEIEFQPGKGWGIGDNVNVTIPQIGKTSNVMRVKDAEYSTTSERYTLIEDEGTI